MRHPELVIQDLYRGDDQYLDFTRVSPDLLIGRVRTGLIDLLELYRQHVAQYNEQSIAHLCIGIATFTDLTQNGIHVRYGKTIEPRHVTINTIDQLRDVLTTDGVRIVTTRSRKGKPFFASAVTRENALFEKLSDWESISEQSAASI